MKIFYKLLKFFTKIGAKIIWAFNFVVGYADRLIHYKEYKRKARRRRVIWTVILSILGGIVAILVFPYRLIVKRNGDFEVRTLLFRVSRKTPEYEIPTGGNESFEIPSSEVVGNTEA